MKIKILDYGYENKPVRKHANDAGLDVSSLEKIILKPNETKAIKLGFGVELPIGYAAIIQSRSSGSISGLSASNAPIDSGYTGEIHAIITNTSSKNREIEIGERIAQMVVYPISIVDLEEDLGETRGANGLGSTGKM